MRVTPCSNRRVMCKLIFSGTTAVSPLVAGGPALADALHHRPNWTEATPEELRAKVEPIVASDAWVIDGAYRGKLGDLVLEGADLVVWLDLPVRVWLPRLVRRTARRIATREELWNGNREELRYALHPRYSVVVYAVRSYRERRRRYASELVYGIELWRPCPAAPYSWGYAGDLKSAWLKRRLVPLGCEGVMNDGFTVAPRELIQPWVKAGVIDAKRARYRSSRERAR